MHPAKPPLILASRSPRRLELLRLAGCEPLVAVAAVDEEALTREFLGPLFYAKSITPDRAAGLTACLAARKAAAVRPRHPDAVILGADTLVWLDGRILGQPVDDADAVRMLRALSGRSHVVHTAVTILYPAAAGRADWRFESATEVDFWPLTPVQERLIDAYVADGLSRGKAGAYGIQDRGGLFVRAIRGDYGTVVGLPLAAVMHELLAAGCV
ncbi:MAG: Maf family protein [Bacillota bacterium]|nr:Maf family protein [Bacillota bacterium]